MPSSPSSISSAIPRIVSTTTEDVGESATPAAQVGRGRAAAEYKFAMLALSAAWWPRGVGLHVDDGPVRHEFEPPEGARTWLQLTSIDEGWTAPGSSAIHHGCGGPGFDGSLPFLAQLLHQLNGHLGGLDPRARAALPRDAEEMRFALARHAPQRGRAPQVRTLERGPACDFRAGEVLSPPAPLGSRDSLEALKAAVAGRLGAVLLERFGWDRPTALARAPFDQLARMQAQGLAQGAVWSLRVTPDRGVALMLRQGRTESSLGAVLPPGPHLAGVAIYRPRKTDNLEGTWQCDADLYNGSRRPVGPFMLPEHMPLPDPRRPLAGLDPMGRILVVGHGAVVPAAGRLPRVLSVGGKGPRSMARTLIREGLPADFKGTVQLDACYSAQGLGSDSSYARRLQTALAAKGWKQVTVAGRPGLTRGVHNQALTVPSEVAGTGGGAVHGTPTGPDAAWRGTLATRLLAGLKRFFSRPSLGHADSDARDFETIGVRGMWGRIGAKTPGAARARVPR